MPQWIVLIRGINVGGKNRVKMADLRSGLAKNEDISEVESYIQSGNLWIQSKVRSATKISQMVASCLEETFGVNVVVQSYARQHFHSIVEACPFRVPETDLKTVHILFLAAPADSANLDGIRERQAASEAWELSSDAFYLHAPGGIGRSKLVRDLERLLGTTGTARNLRTVHAVLNLGSH